MRHAKKTSIGKVIMVVLTLAVVAAFQLPVMAQIFEQNLTVSQNAIDESSGLTIDSERLAAITTQYDDVELLTGDAFIAQSKRIEDVFNDTTLTPEAKEIILSELGVYEVDGSLEADLVASTEDNVTLNKPQMFYSTSTKEFTIIASGYWKSADYWASDISTGYVIGKLLEINIAALLLPEGKIVNIGGSEAVGISLSNTSGSSTGLILKNGNARLKSSPSTTSTSIATSDDKYGVVFKPQDKVKIIGITDTGYTIEYNAHTFSVSATFNNIMGSKYHGTARLYYCHTYENTKITSLSLSTTGVSASWSQEDKAWHVSSLGVLF